jgi:hypothetical protein
MKVGFLDKKRKINEWPTSMAELRKVVSRKFTEKNLLDDSNATITSSQLLESQ